MASGTVRSLHHDHLGATPCFLYLFIYIENVTKGPYAAFLVFSCDPLVYAICVVLCLKKPTNSFLNGHRPTSLYPSVHPLRIRTD